LLAQGQIERVDERGVDVSGLQAIWPRVVGGSVCSHLPDVALTFTGDLVYVDRILGVLPQSNVRKAQAAFKRLVALGSKHVVPGHGRVTDLAQAKRDTGDYYDFKYQ